MDRTIINPLSGRRIKVGKATYRKVMKLKSNIDKLHQISRNQTTSFSKKQNKAKEYLLKLNID